MSHHNVENPLGDHFVTPEQYDGLPRSRAQQKLTPLDMNMPRVYGARWILCFPLPPGTSTAQVYENLKEGLARTIRSIPWIAGKVGPEEGQDPKRNRIQVVDSPMGLKFPCRDLTGILPPYPELKKEGFPLSKLSTAQVGPIGALPQGAEQQVLAVQANFMEGGLLLTVGVHHSVCDTLALYFIVHAWSRNTAIASGASSKPFTVYDAQSNDRSPLMEGMPGANLVDFPEYTRRPSADVSAEQMPQVAARIFRFSLESLAKLKAAAAAFSTNDALSAFIWQRITLARTRSGVFADPSPGGGEEASALGYAVNIRSRTSPPLPLSYLGNASIAYLTQRLAISTLASDTALPRAAIAIRKSMDAADSPNRVPLTIGLLSQLDPMDLKFTYNASLGPDVFITSWAGLKVYESDWGVLGMVDSIRIPGEGEDGIAIVLPRLRDGSLEVSIGLRIEAMEELLEDEEFVKVAQL
ncbi:hypothetical protein ACJZ2D_015402 [Fusarium nematophilum]